MATIAQIASSLTIALCLNPVLPLQVPSTRAFTSASGLPVCQYGLGGAARSVQPATLPSLYQDLLRQQSDGDDGDEVAPFLFYYNPHRYPLFLSGISDLCDETPRENIFVASGGTDRSVSSLDQRLADALVYCGGDYLDLFVHEYVCREELIKDNDEIGPEVQAALEYTAQWVQQGKVRYVAASTHSHVVGKVLAHSSKLDALMLRYGMSHKDAAQRVSFPACAANNKPVIAFTTTRWNALQDGHDDWSFKAPTTGDCLSYAFASSSDVQVVLHSARDESELEDAMTNLRTTMTPTELQQWDAYGKLLEDENDDHFDEYPEERLL